MSMLSQDQQVLEEQAFLLEKDYRFQLQRVQKNHEEELDKLKAIEDQLRNDNFLKAQRNHNILKTLEEVDAQITNDLVYLLQNNQVESKDFKDKDQIQAQIRDVKSIYEEQIKGKYVEKNPVIQELEKELEYLEKENVDLNERNQKLEKEIYNRIHGNQFDHFQQNRINEQATEDLQVNNFNNSSYSMNKGEFNKDYSFYSQKWNLHGYSTLEQNKKQNLTALERARQIIHSDTPQYSNQYTTYQHI